MPENRNDGVLTEFLRGASFLFRGFRVWVSSPRLMLLGSLPPLIVGLLFTALFIVLVRNLGTLATWLTGFAQNWSEVARVGAQFTAAIAIAVLAGLIVLISFVTLTLIVGGPFYQRIWRAVERQFGGLPEEVPVPFLRGLGESVLSLGRTIVVGIGLFAIGLIPVAGSLLAGVLGFAFAGWFLTLELTSFVFEPRGLSLKVRRRILRSARARSIGFGVATFAVFLIPGGALLAMPAAVAGATLLGHSFLPEPRVARHGDG